MSGPLVRRCVVLGATLLALPASYAMDPPSPRPLRLSRPRVYAASGQVVRLYGGPLAWGATPAASAQQFVDAYAETFGLSAAQLRPGCRSNGLYTQPAMYEPHARAHKFTLVYYSQYAGDLPVYDGELRILVRNAESFPVVWAASTLRPVGDVDPGTATNEAAAHAAAAELVPGLVNFGPSERVVWAGTEVAPEKPAVAAVFEADNGRPGSPDYVKRRFIADAASGAVLHQVELFLHVDIVGSVRGQATAGVPPKADVCNPEALTPMPHAKVGIGSTTVYADGAGNFVIPWSGSDPVAVTSWIAGRWFDVANQAGPNTLLTMAVTPPGPANFVHNLANSSEYNRAEVNAYIQVNAVRDFALAYNPSYPVIWNESHFAVHVNYDATCGASYYDNAITLFRSGTGCANTAFSGIIHHEYGHHLVAVAGSGQGAYGEGIGDSVAALLADDAGLGYGFYLGDCVNPIRSADNTVQYPCSSDPYTCGRLLSGCVWSTRNALASSLPHAYRETIANLTINSILLHTGSQITPAITIDFLTLDDDDGDITNGTPHSAEICSGFGAHNMNCPPLHVLGDLDCNGTVDFDDIDPFVLALADASAYQAQYPDCYVGNADCNADGALDFDDINAFVEILSQARSEPRPCASATSAARTLHGISFDAEQRKV